MLPGNTGLLWKSCELINRDDGGKTRKVHLSPTPNTDNQLFFPRQVSGVLTEVMRRNSKKSAKPSATQQNHQAKLEVVLAEMRVRVNGRNSWEHNLEINSMKDT